MGLCGLCGPGYRIGDDGCRHTTPVTHSATELEVAAIEHAIEVYTGPDDDTVPVLRGLAKRLSTASLATTRAGEKVVPIDRLEAVLAAHPAPQTEDEA